MAVLVLRRLFRALGTAAGIAVLGYLLIQVRSEEALGVLAEARNVRGEAGVALLRTAYGLDRPLGERLLAWLGGIARGDLGEAWSRPGTSVVRVVAEHLPLTLALTSAGLVLQLLLGIGLAAASILARGSLKDALLNALALALHALPEFCLGLLLLWPFAIKLGWLPLSGAAGAPWETGGGRLATLLDHARHLVLPATALALAGVATVARLVRVRWEEELGARYVTGAVARGISRRAVVFRHGLRNAAGPLCASLGLSLPALVGGAVLVERVFNWPGLGRVFVDAVAARDLNLVAGINLLLALLVVAGGLLSELLFAWIDPRVRVR